MEWHDVQNSISFVADRPMLNRPAAIIPAANIAIKTKMYFFREVLLLEEPLVILPSSSFLAEIAIAEVFGGPLSGQLKGVDVLPPQCSAAALYSKALAAITALYYF
ncbi:MAG: hypothetical protein MI754_02845 [Chromatiales bacterium]|nr:hypothetical protein [Chromatiales bacterium]